MKYLVTLLLLFSQVSHSSENCIVTDEYNAIRKEAREIVYGNDNSFARCKKSVEMAEYWRAMAKCESYGDGRDIGGGCAHLVGRGRYQEPVDMSHCDVFKFEPSRDLVNEIVEEQVQARGVRRCKNI
ncbi:hypothetical protein BTA51_09195 [Hahella sp. CCB-MM4]|uniref:hypothetical protein n=1 Tax=Hahella sp. (strain CCB-MM4) TaxID=1926491 RepID=UPI000B9B3085|nr:hypothetical protein [Hahella sp. CCB-MM4]OZG73945.1 hypothetical protein BTA51_09195 [Hahella sp. CCB-MM4]